MNTLLSSIASTPSISPPSAVVGVGDTAIWYDFSDSSTLKQDVLGTVPVSSVNDPVAYAADLIGGGYHATVPALSGVLWKGGYTELDVNNVSSTTNVTSLWPVIVGTLVVATSRGMWVDGNFSFSGGSFNISESIYGGNTVQSGYTGGPRGIWTAISTSGTSLRVYGIFAINRALTDNELKNIRGYYRAKGCPGVITVSNVSNIIVNPDFNSGVTSWSAQSPGTRSASGGILTVTNSSTLYGGGAYQSTAVSSGLSYIFEFNMRASAGTTGGNAVVTYASFNFGLTSALSVTSGVYASYEIAMTSDGSGFRSYIQANPRGAVNTKMQADYVRAYQIMYPT